MNDGATFLNTSIDIMIKHLIDVKDKCNIYRSRQEITRKSPWLSRERQGGQEKTIRHSCKNNQSEWNHGYIYWEAIRDAIESENGSNFLVKYQLSVLHFKITTNGFQVSEKESAGPAEK